MKILITGNMGYIGPVVTKHLLQSNPGLQILGIDTGYFAHCLTGTSALPERLIEAQYFQDLRRFESDMLKGIDVVVHLAAISNDPIGKEFEEVTYAVNLDATVALAMEAKAAGVGSFISASSCSMYGQGTDAPRDEQSVLAPLTAYAKSKVEAEKRLMDCADAGFTVTSLRFSTACGMSSRLRLDLVLNDFVASALSTGTINVLSDGTPWRPIIHVKDMAAAIGWATHRKRSNGGDFVAVNIGSKHLNYQIGELAEATARCLPGTQVSINKAARPDKRSYRVDFSLFEKLAPSHQPRFDLDRSIRDLRDGLRAMKFRDENFRKSHFMRLKVLQDLQEDGCLDSDLCWAGRRPA